MAPELAELLSIVPSEARHGWVFRPISKIGEPYCRTRHAIGPIVSQIGEKAGVVVDERSKRKRDGDGKPKDVITRKFASAHELRRSFGFRWSRRVMPAVLKELMRHESIETTMKYYVGHNAAATADELWRAVESEEGNLLGNTSSNGHSAEKSEHAANSYLA